MDSSFYVTIGAVAVAIINLIPQLSNKKLKKDVAEIKEHCKKTTEMMNMRKEESIIAFEAAEAAIDAAISLGKNGDCVIAKNRMMKYKEKVIEQRL